MKEEGFTENQILALKLWSCSFSYPYALTLAEKNILHPQQQEWNNIHSNIINFKRFKRLEIYIRKDYTVDEAIIECEKHLTRFIIHKKVDPQEADLSKAMINSNFLDNLKGFKPATPPSRPHKSTFKPKICRRWDIPTASGVIYDTLNEQ